MGLAVFLEVSHSSELDFATALKPLAGFGLVHGCHEWFEMFILIDPEVVNGSNYIWINIVRLIMLASSFLMLISFGARLIAGPGRNQFQWTMLIIVIIIWLLGLLWIINVKHSESNQIIAADVYTRYALAIPGAALTMWGLLLQRQKFIQMGMRSFGRDVAIAALAFGLYGGIGQLFTAPSTIFPSSFLNADAFIRWFGFPVQVFRAAIACVAAIFVIRSLRAFEEENNRRIELMREIQLTERHHLENLRAELLHRTVKAQEAERQRIAHELHDETGQTLTALGLGLRGLTECIATNPQRAAQQAKQLESVAVAGLEELQHLVGGLHPPQLDDLGLTAALRWYAEEVNQKFGLPVRIITHGTPFELPLDVRTVFFRIAQEAITNIVRHADADQGTINLKFSDSRIIMQILDDGRGFDKEAVLGSGGPFPHWGLLGMMERAKLIGGDWQISSKPGKGTIVEVSIQFESEINE